MNTPVFVYGSLRKGMYNHSLLGCSIDCGTWRTCEEYYMVGLASNAFPYVTPFPIFQVESTRIVGELYLVAEDVLKRLDILEGHPHHYTRVIVSIEKEGEVRDAFLYMMVDEKDAECMRQNLFRFVPVEGDWVKHLEGVT